MNAAVTPTRPALRWFGGKWRLAPWIVQHQPKHRVYVEPFGGAASVLLRKPRVHAEVWNDLDGELVNLFRVLRDPAQAELLTGLLWMTPFARAEFDASYTHSPDPVERARRLVIRSYMGFGSASASRAAKTGFRSNSSRSGTTPAGDWANYPAAVRTLVERMRGVIIESRDALAVMDQHDGPDTLHYVDPPYVPETRGRAHRWNGYTHELTNADHERLLAAVTSLRGMVMISGYPCALYDEALTGWRRLERHALADGALPRREVLWINPTAAARLHADLFEDAPPAPRCDGMEIVE